MTTSGRPTVKPHNTAVLSRWGKLELTITDLPTEPPERPPTTRLARRLGTADAVVIALGSMLGAGVFAALGPAAEAAGSGLVLGLALAAAVAYCNATSSAQLAAVHPEAGGTYVYGRERLGAFWGHLAGWAFVVGKAASCAAMALTFGAYATPRWQRALAVAAVVLITAVNYHGVRKTVWVIRLLLAVVLASLAAAVVATLGGGSASIGKLDGVLEGDLLGVFRAGGILFFAFAGYARIATLGEEVIDPARTIPRAVPLALGIATAIYAVIAVSALAAVGPGGLAGSDAPLAAAAGAGSLGWLAPAVRVGGTVAALSVLLSLLAGVSRTAFAMAADGELPRRLAAVHPRHRVPHRAELAVGALVVAVVATADIRGAIGFSSFAVLAYYAVANAAAWTLPAKHRRWPRPVTGAGLVGCLALAFTLPATSVAAGMGVLGLGIALRAVGGRGSAQQR